MFNVWYFLQCFIVNKIWFYAICTPLHSNFYLHTQHSSIFQIGAVHGQQWLLIQTHRQKHYPLSPRGMDDKLSSSGFIHLFIYTFIVEQAIFVKLCFCVGSWCLKGRSFHRSLQRNYCQWLFSSTAAILNWIDAKTSTAVEIYPLIISWKFH